MWGPEHATADLPRRIMRHFQHHAIHILDELEDSGVELMPAPEPRHTGHMIRVSRNPQWYRDIYHSREHFRKDRSIDALLRIGDGTDHPLFPRRGMENHYDTLYRALILDRLLLGYQTDNDVFAPVPAIQRHFGIPPTSIDDFYAALYGQSLNRAREHVSP